MQAHSSEHKILLVGPPGSGKGTQGVRLAEALGVAHLAVGDLLRAEIAAETPLGRTIKAEVADGHLVSDDLVIELLTPHVLDAAKSGGYILDGFPRSVAQANKGREIAEAADARPDLVVYLDVPDAVVVERLLARAAIEGRADDNEATIRNRLAVFHAETAPLLDHYTQQGIARTVDATGAPDDVTAAILSVVRGS